MEIGTIMMIIGIMGIIAGMVLLFLLPGIFRKQRKKMMEEIGEDLSKREACEKNSPALLYSVFCSAESAGFYISGRTVGVTVSDSGHRTGIFQIQTISEIAVMT